MLPSRVMFTKEVLELINNTIMKQFRYVILILMLVVACTKEVCNNTSDALELENKNIITKSTYDSLNLAYGTFVDYYSDSTKQLVTLSNGLIVEKIGDVYVFESDIIFSDSTLYVLEAIPNINSRSAATNAPVKYWPNRMVPYVFDSSFTTDYRNEAIYAMSLISNSTGVRFVPAESYHTNRIKFCYSNANNSYLGMQGGTQIINIYNKNYGVIMHEILHSLGFFHEHSRADRDSYIIINRSNIKSDKLHNFNKYSSGLDIGAFDYNSIMLYGSMTTDTDFVYDITKPMITKLDGSIIYENRSYLSAGDIIGIQSIYGPPYHKLVVYEDIIQDYVDYDTEIYEVEKTFKIEFFEDEACTIHTSLSYPRLLKLREYETYCDVATHQVFEGHSDRIITIPAGISEYTLETYTHYERYIQSIPYDVNTKRYIIINYH